MPITKFISDDAKCTRTIIEGEESWEINISGKILRTKDAAYASISYYQESKDHYANFLSSLNKSYDGNFVYDFIDDLRLKNFKEKGGYVIFFLKLRGEYNLAHTKEVKRIEEIV